MSYTAKYQFRVREQDAGRPAPHNRVPTVQHHTYDQVSNMAHHQVGNIRERHMGAGELSQWSYSYQPPCIQNLGETNPRHDTYAESDPRNDSFSGLHRLTNNDPTLTSLTIWNEDFAYKHAHWLRDGLANALHLTQLDLRWAAGSTVRIDRGGRFNKIGDESARAICDGLKANRTLTQLAITPNKWSSDVAQKWVDRALAHGGWVATNDSIQHCDARDARSPVYHRLASSLALR